MELKTLLQKIFCKAFRNAPLFEMCLWQADISTASVPCINQGGRFILTEAIMVNHLAKSINGG